MRMKDKVCCRDQVQRGCDLCQQYRRQPNIELDIKNMPLEHRCEAYVMLETVLRYEGESLLTRLRRLSICSPPQKWMRRSS